MDHLILKLNIFIRPTDAQKRVDFVTKQMIAQKISQQEIVLPITKCIIEEIETNTRVIHITISYVSIIPMTIIQFLFYCD